MTIGGPVEPELPFGLPAPQRPLLLTPSRGLSVAAPSAALGSAVSVSAPSISAPSPPAPSPSASVEPAPRAWTPGGREARALLRRYRSLAITSDAGAAAVAAVVALVGRFGADWPVAYVGVSVVVPAAWIALVALHRGYEGRYLGTGPEEYRRMMISAMVLFIVLAVTSFVVRGDLSRAYVLVVVPAVLVLSLTGRHLLRTWIYRLRVAGQGLLRVLVVGRADAARAVIETFRTEPHHGLHAIAACVPEAAGGALTHVHGVPVVGGPDRILDAVDAVNPDVVAVVSHPDLAGQSLRRLSWALEERSVDLVVSPGIIEVAGPRLSIRPVAGLSLLHLERPPLGGARMFAKAVFDRVLGSLMLLVSLPLLALVAVAVRLESPGPVLFRQERVGVAGTRFRMLKFRSMIPDAEERRPRLGDRNEGNGMLFKIRDDPRVTRVGSLLRRFSLDELPQLVNVVRGDMSLVGPRPPLPDEVAGYDGDAVRRLRVRPGMTGLWQVSGRSDLSWEESLRLDLRYVDNWSMALDLSILWRTWRAVIRGSGAY